MLTSGRICPGESPREPPLGCDEVGGQGKMPDGAESNSHRSARFRGAVPLGKVSWRDGVKVFPVGRGHRTGVFWGYPGLAPGYVLGFDAVLRKQIKGHF